MRQIRGAFRELESIGSNHLFTWSHPDLWRVKATTSGQITFLRPVNPEKNNQWLWYCDIRASGWHLKSHIAFDGRLGIRLG
jgi:hypothetical protein